MSSFVHHAALHHEIIFHSEIKELSSRIGVSHRYLNGLDVEFLRERNRILYGLAGFSRESQDKVTMNYQPEFVSIFCKLASALNRGSLLDVFQNLLVARFVADDQQSASGFFHGFQRFVISGYARRAGPR